MLGEVESSTIETVAVTDGQGVLSQQPAELPVRIPGQQQVSAAPGPGQFSVNYQTRTLTFGLGLVNGQVQATYQLAVVPPLTPQQINDLVDAVNNGAGITLPVPIVDGGTGEATAAAAFGALSPLAAKGDVLGHDGNNNVRVPVGANDKPLVADSSASSGVAYKTLPIAGGGTGQTTQTAAMDALSPTTTKGDLLVDNGTNVVRVPVGTNGQVLAASSGEAAGVKWEAKTAAGDEDFGFVGLLLSPVDEDFALAQPVLAITAHYVKRDSTGAYSTFLLPCLRQADQADAVQNGQPFVSLNNPSEVRLYLPTGLVAVADHTLTVLYIYNP